MLIKILIGFSDGSDHYEKGEVYEVSKNLAHGLLERGFAKQYFGQKEMIAPPKDKMFSKRRKKLMTK